jgi:hypothetical protein
MSDIDENANPEKYMGWIGLKASLSRGDTSDPEEHHWLMPVPT